MDSLPEHLIQLPIPCVALAVYDEAQAKLRDDIILAGRANTTNNQQRLNVLVCNGSKVTDASKSDESQWEQELPPRLDWVLLQRRAPPCLVCVRDWQHYIVEDIATVANSHANSAVAEADLEGSESQSLEQGDAHHDDTEGGNRASSSKSEVMRGELKHLAELVKVDIEQCLNAYRRNLLDKRPVQGKIIFLVLLREGTKNPHKAVSGLKHLNPNEVAAICVTSGAGDIANKVAKLEQLLYDVGIAYYEKRVSLLAKVVNKSKTNARPEGDEDSEISAALLNFKLGYFHQFLGNFKESAQALSQAWRLVAPSTLRNPTEDHVTLALYIALQLINVHFASSNLLEALTFVFEAVVFFTKAVAVAVAEASSDMATLYHNVVYLIQYTAALHLDRSREYKELKENNHVRQHAVNFYKWSIHHLLKLRTLIARGGMNNKPGKRFANLLLKDDEDFGHLFVEGALWDSGSSSSSSNGTEQRLKNLEAITERMLVQLIDLLSTCSWYNTLIQVTEMLGDSLFLSSNLLEALFIYSNIGEALINATALDTDYILKSCSSPVISEEFRRIHTSRVSVRSGSSNNNNGEPIMKEETLRLLPNFLKHSTTLLVAEHVHSKGWWAVYKRILAKMMVTQKIVLKHVITLPESIKQASGLPMDIYETLMGRSAGYGVHDKDIMKMAEAESTLIWLKSLLTLSSVTSDEVDLDRACTQLALTIWPRNDISSAILLSKHHKGQYMLGRAEVSDNSTATRLQVLINFHVDLPFSIDVSSVTICTSIGTFDFEISETVVSEGHTEIYTTGCRAGFDMESSNNAKREDCNSRDPTDEGNEVPSVEHSSGGSSTSGGGGGGKVISLDGDRNVFLAITCPPINNKFMVDSFKLLGLKFLWKKVLPDGITVNVLCLLPSLTNYTPLGQLGSAEYSLFTSDISSGKFSMKESLYRLGVSTSTLKAEEVLQMTMTNHKASNVTSSMVDTIVELMSVSHANVEISDTMPTESSSMAVSYEHGTCRMFINRIYFKVFMGTLVEGHFAPITCILLYNKQILGAQNLPHIKFSVEVASSANSFVFYILCKDNGIKGGSGGGGGCMRQCLNNKFVFTLTEFADANGFDLELALDTSDSNPPPDMDAVVPALFSDDRGKACSISDEMDSFLELVRKDSNVGIVHIHGLLKILSHGRTNVQFNLQMQPMLGNTLKAVESNFLVVTDITEAWVHEPVQLHLAMDLQYNNVDANFMRYLIMQLLNKTEVQYEIEHVKVLYEDKVIAKNSELYGFYKQLQSRQTLQFISPLPLDVKSENSLEVQCVHSVIHPAVFPFDRLQRCFMNLTTKTLPLSNQHEATEIAILVKHTSTIELSQPFEVVAEIRNLTAYTLDYCVTLPNMDEERTPFIISGPRVLEITALPRDVSTVTWTLMGNRCGHHTLPTVKVMQRRTVSLSKDLFESVPSKIYVGPQRLLQVEQCGEHASTHKTGSC